MKPAPVVLITGAAAGIGKATALAFARLGYRLLVTDLKAESGPPLLAELKAAGGMLATWSRTRPRKPTRSWR